MSKIIVCSTVGAFLKIDRGSPVPNDDVIALVNSVDLSKYRVCHVANHLSGDEVAGNLKVLENAGLKQEIRDAYYSEGRFLKDVTFSDICAVVDNRHAKELITKIFEQADDSDFAMYYPNRSALFQLGVRLGVSIERLNNILPDTQSPGRAGVAGGFLAPVPSNM